MIKMVTPNPLLESLKVIGRWWLPDRPDDEIYGQLIYEDNKDLILSTTGVFSDFHIRAFPSFPIIHGLTNEGRKLTLCNCDILEAERSYPGRAAEVGTYHYGKSVIICSFAFLDIHINNIEQRIFNGAYIRFENQEILLGDKVVSIQEHLCRKPSSDDINQYIVAYNIPTIKKYELKNFVLRINYTIEMAHDIIKPDDIINYDSTFEIIFSEPQNISSIFSTTKHFQNFISLFYGHYAKLKSFRVSLSDDPAFPWYLLYNQKISSIPNYGMEHHINMIETFKNLSNPINLLNNWFDNIDFFSLLFGLYFSSKANPNRYITDYFLSLTQAIDTYHIRKNEREYIKIEEFNKVKVKFLEIIKKLPKNKQDHFKNKVKYMNNKSLRSRLKEIGKTFDYLKDILNILDGDNIAKIVDTRNYYTHYDPEDELKAIPISEIHHYIKPLRLLILAIILDEIGLSEEEIRKYIDKPIYMSWKW